MNKKKISIFIGTIAIVMMVIGTSTYAWFKWRTSLEQTVNINLTVSSIITFIGGPDVTGILDPVYNYSDGIKKDIKIKSEVSGDTFNLYFKINTLPDELKGSFFHWAIYSEDTYITGGDFENSNVNDNVTLLLNRPISTSDYDTYSVYFWIDAEEDLSPSIGNKTIKFSLYATGESGAINELDEN